MTRAAKFTQADIQRAVRAMKAVGETVTGVDIRPDGSFRVLTGEKAEAPVPNQLDHELADWGRRHGYG